MSLHPQDDNRDGVAIRIASERLLRRSHNQRFLIVFSDGEPSAYNYAQDGILEHMRCRNGPQNTVLKYLMCFKSRCYNRGYRTNHS